MKKAGILCLMAVAVASLGFRKNAKEQFHIPKGWPQPAYDFAKNPLRTHRIALGRLLFYDPTLSRDSTISCASCHAPFNSFTHTDHSLSHGIDGKIGTRNSPVLINLAWSSSFMWDGSITHLDEQARTPITHKLEMDECMAEVVGKLQASNKYRQLFKQAFGKEAVTEKNTLMALSQFMLTLVSANARYDSMMRGECKFTEKEQRGYELFKRNCASCHQEPLFTNNGFENNGLTVDDSLKDIGRMRMTLKAEDSLKFKVPTLRNIEYSQPYMHDGRFKTIGQVLNNYIMGIQHSPTLSPKLQKGIYMTNNEKSDMAAFLHTLSDRTFITDPRFGMPGK